MEDITKTLDVLTAMIAANNKRTKVYLSSAEKSPNPELKSLFAHYADQSRRFAGHLSTWRSAYGGFAHIEKENGAIAMIKSMLELAFRKGSLARCEDLEHDTLRRYKSAVNMSFIPSAVIEDLQKQAREFEKALIKMHMLRDQPAVGREVFART